MTIYTRFGTQCQVIKPLDNEGWLTIAIDYKDGRHIVKKEVHVSDLKADNGFNEIVEASNVLANPASALLTRFEKANWYLSNVVMHPEQWHDHEYAINFAKQWVFECAKAIAEYKS